MSTSFYTTELEATTALVLDRSAFLDSVTDAVTSEHADKDAQKMVSILGNASFMALLPALLSDKDTGIRSKAYLALGNLIASDNANVANLTFTTVSRYTGTIGTAFTVAETAAGAAYLVANLAQRIVSWKGDYNTQKPVVADLVVKGLTNNPSASSLRDLLYAAKYLDISQQVPTDLLINALKDQSSKCRGIALYHLAEQVSNEFAAEFHASCYMVLRDLVLSGRKLSASKMFNLMWALSNLVTEAEMPAAFLTDCDLMEQVCELTGSDDSNAAREATWTLIHAITLADITTTPTGVLDKINATLKTAIFSFAYSLNTEIKGATLKIDAEILRRAAAESFNYSEDTDDDMEIDDTATLPVEEEEDYEAWHDYINYEIPAPPSIEIPAAAGAGSCFPPNAIDLLMGDKYYEGTSRVVYDLIYSVIANGNQFTPVPENVTLSIADLRALEARGFVIARGCVGINALLSSIC